jgi:hypothetical protein
VLDVQVGGGKVGGAVLAFGARYRTRQSSGFAMKKINM